MLGGELEPGLLVVIDGGPVPAGVGGAAVGV